MEVFAFIGFGLILILGLSSIFILGYFIGGQEVGVGTIFLIAITSIILTSIVQRFYYHPDEFGYQKIDTVSESEAE